MFERHHLAGDVRMMGLCRHHPSGRFACCPIQGLRLFLRSDRFYLVSERPSDCLFGRALNHTGDMAGVLQTNGRKRSGTRVEAVVPGRAAYNREFVSW